MGGALIGTLIIFFGCFIGGAGCLIYILCTPNAQHQSETRNRLEKAFGSRK